MTPAIRRLSLFFLVAFMSVAFALGYWGLLRQDDILARQDNPRRVLDEQSIQRGRIVDRNDIVLAETHKDISTGLGTRNYIDPSVAPIVGYYSLRHGVGGIESAYDDMLRGNTSLTPLRYLTNQLLHQPQIGSDIRLTIDLTIQREVEQLLAGEKGTVIVVMAPQGDVLAMGSQPSFDPNNLDDMWNSLKSDPNAPLLNRATQSLYQPGTVLQGIILGTSINVGATMPEEEWSGNLVVDLGSAQLPCADSPSLPVNSFRDAFLWACPRPLQVLENRLGAHVLEDTLRDFGLLEPPAFELPIAVAPYSESTTDPALLAIGQSDLTVSALQMALVAATFADHGQMPAPRLVQAIRDPGGQWIPTPLLGTPRGTISRASADQISQLMARAVTSGAARSAQQSDLAIHGQVGLALSGPESSFNSWFIGFAYHANGDAVAVSVLLEETNDISYAARIGGEMLRITIESLQ